MSPKLKRITPTEEAIHIIDRTIRELEQKRGELIAQLPRRRPPKNPTVIRDPFNGRKWDFKKKCYVD
jgi:hypothetical protein